MIFEHWEWLIVFYLPGIFYIDWRSKNHGECTDILRDNARDRVRDRLEIWKDRQMKFKNWLLSGWTYDEKIKLVKFCFFSTAFALITLMILIYWMTQFQLR